MFGRRHAALPLGNLKQAIESWTRLRLWLQVLIGLFLGVAAGILAGPELGLVAPRTSAAIGAWLALPGKIFLGLISIVLIPLVFGSILQGLTGTRDAGTLRTVGFSMLVFVIVTTSLAAMLGVSLANRIGPGEMFADEAAQEQIVGGRFAPLPRDKPVSRAAPDIIAGVLPTNPQQALLEQDMLAIVFLAILLALACRQAPTDKVRAFLSVIDALVEISMVVVKWAMFLTPYAVFGLTAQMVAQQGLATVAGMGLYVGTVLLVLVVLLAGYLLLVALFGRNPLAFSRSIFAAQLLGFSTSSSAAVMPLSIETLVSKLGVERNIAAMVVPLGATINMAGTALYQAVAVIFLAQMTGLDLSTGEQGMIVATLVVSSIGAPGTPGVSILILSNVIVGFGISPLGLPLILGVDRLLDMARTAVNVTGDLAAGVIIGGHTRTPPNEEPPPKTD